MLVCTISRTYILIETGVEVEELGPVHSEDIISAPAGNIASNSQKPQISGDLEKSYRDLWSKGTPWTNSSFVFTRSVDRNRPDLRKLSF